MAVDIPAGATYSAGTVTVAAGLAEHSEEIVAVGWQASLADWSNEWATTVGILGLVATYLTNLYFKLRADRDKE